MTIDEFIDKIQRLKRAGRITGDESLMLRNPEISEDAMEAGSDGYHEADEILVPGDERVIVLGEDL